MSIKNLYIESIKHCKYINLNVYNYKIIVYKMDRYLYNYLYIYIVKKSDEQNEVQRSRYILNLITCPYYVHSTQA